MLILGIVFIVVSIAMYFISLFVMDGEQSLGYAFGMSTIVIFIIGVTCIASVCDKDKPDAIDVYRGYTTLQITYEDSIPTDTVVVFKKQYKKD